MSQFIPLEEELGKIIFTKHDGKSMLVFEGDDGFRDRMSNFVHNFCPRRGEVRYLYAAVSFVHVSEESVKAGLKLYFYCQIAKGNDRPADVIDAAAEKRAQKFWDKQITIRPEQQQGELYSALSVVDKEAEEMAKWENSFHATAREYSLYSPVSTYER